MSIGTADPLGIRTGIGRDKSEPHSDERVHRGETQSDERVHWDVHPGLARSSQ